ncbi:NUC189-domain-containing protein [Venturia nashicola]|uniref:NUC189-domain-containing protein n=1 Tax=Venturia nashicola TaxID=86259 RepID=A0A4Z1PG36_9PEZI|nr:NUC189-domain-containing protein [Venturia nashicola]TLD36796.1 NUC189-domain-containing protein [Venturia nashicola]
MAPAVSSSRVRPSPSDPAPGPPAKRARHSNDGKTNGLAGLLLNNKAGSKLSAAYTKIPKSSKATKVNDNDAVISRPDGHGDVDQTSPHVKEVVEISSDESSDGDSSEEEEPEKPEVKGIEKADISKTIVNGAKQDSIDPSDAGGPEEPSFGEQLQASVTEPIDVETTLADAADEAFAVARIPGPRALSAPSANSLGTVLTQALRTNDRDLLESCFEMNDLESVRSTIERLPSHLVSVLLPRLAERIHKRPGRAGNLMVWVQWAIVSHGGYLAGQPEVMLHMGSLIRVIKERANGLQPLLQLKGKLDMLSAQLELRRSIQARSAKDQEQEEEEAVIYVEGQDETSSDDEQRAIEAGVTSSPTAISRHLKRSRKHADDSDESEDDFDAGVQINGIQKTMDGEVDSSDDEVDLLDEEESGSEDEETDASGLEESGAEDEGMEEVADSEDEEERPVKRSVITQSRGW